MNKDLKYYLQRAQKGGWALGAFNVANFETLAAVVGAAKKLRAPVLIEASASEISYLGLETLKKEVEIARRKNKLPLFVNLDHGKTAELVRQAIDNKFDLVHFDGSRLPYSSNLRKIKPLVQAAHAKKVLVEGEIDAIYGTSSLHQKKEKIVINYTSLAQACAFVKESGVDILAVSIGNLHGIYTKTNEKLNLRLLKELHKKLNCFFSLHGGSGIGAADLKKAVKLGVVKVNINTELRVAYKNTLMKSIKRSGVAVYDYMPPVIAAVERVVAEKIKILGSAGKA